jgi:hypothetical protein
MLRITFLFTFIISLVISQNLWARGNPFESGQMVLTPRLKPVEIYKRTMGTPSWKAIRQVNGNFEKYVAKRGIKSIAGKAFEARTASRINRFLMNTGSDVRLNITAVAGAPHDPADLLLMDKVGNVLERYQLKLGGRAAMKALRDPKYTGMKIVTPPDQLEWIQKELNKKVLNSQNRGRSLSPDWQMIRDSIEEKRLTSEIVDYKVPTTNQAKSSALSQTGREFGKQSEIRSNIRSLVQKGMFNDIIEMGESVGRVGPTEKYLGQEVYIKSYKIGKEKVFFAFDRTDKPIAYGESAAEAIGKAKSERKVMVVGGVMLIIGGAIDIGFGIYSYHKASQRYFAGELDYDIMVGKKFVAGGQVVLGASSVVVGVLILFPEPVITKVAAAAIGGVVLVGSMICLIADMRLESMQSKRTKHNKRLLAQIDRQARQSICLDSLRKMVAQP